MSAVVEAVGDLISDVGDAIGDVVEGIGDVFEDMGPLLPIVAIAAPMLAPELFALEGATAAVLPEVLVPESLALSSLELPALTAGEMLAADNLALADMGFAAEDIAGGMAGLEGAEAGAGALSGLESVAPSFEQASQNLGTQLSEIGGTATEAIPGIEPLPEVLGQESLALNSSIIPVEGSVIEPLPEFGPEELFFDDAIGQGTGINSPDAPWNVANRSFNQFLAENPTIDSTVRTFNTINRNPMVKAGKTLYGLNNAYENYQARQDMMDRQKAIMDAQLAAYESPRSQQFVPQQWAGYANSFGPAPLAFGRK